MSNLILNVENLHCQYDSHVILSDINFTAQSGSIIGLNGRNGCGKSTLLATLAGIIPYYQGSISIETRDQIKLNKNQEIAWMGTQSPYYPEISVFENLNLWAELNNCPTTTINTLLDYYGLETLAVHPVKKLSCGQRQRLAFCQLQLTAARIWLLDEPFTGLDHQGTNLVKQTIQAFQHNGGIVILAPGHDELPSLALNIEDFCVQSY